MKWLTSSWSAALLFLYGGFAAAHTPLEFQLEHATTVSQADSATAILWYDYGALLEKAGQSASIQIRVRYVADPESVVLLSSASASATLDPSSNWAVLNDTRMVVVGTVGRVTAVVEMLDGTSIRRLGTEVVYLHREHSGLNVIDGPTYRAILRAELARRPAPPGDGALEDGEQAGEAIRPNGEPVDRCGETITCVR